MELTIRQTGEGDLLAFEVALDGTRYAVTAARRDLARLAPGRPPEAVVAASFRFLLDREPKEAILSRFDLAVIARYFPEYDRELPGYLARGDAP